MNSDYAFRHALPEDLPEIRDLLELNEMPSEGLEKVLTHCLVAEHAGRIVGAIGLEPKGRNGLVRSLVVAGDHQGQRLGTALNARMINAARLLGIDRLYLLTTSAEAFFAPSGYKVIEHSRIPAAIRETDEFRKMSPHASTCMLRDIRNVPIHATRELLHMQPAVPGARRWAVGLNNTMLTYLEVEPNSRFETHSHESEQITMVLSGLLFFQIGQTIHRVVSGEVMAIPANVPHSVWTETEAAKVVDAWSPVIEEYSTRIQG